MHLPRLPAWHTILLFSVGCVIGEHRLGIAKCSHGQICSSFHSQVGGMGDVVTALARAVQEEGHRVSVILPKYDIINYAEVRACHVDMPSKLIGLEVQKLTGRCAPLESC